MAPPTLYSAKAQFFTTKRSTMSTRSSIKYLPCVVRIQECQTATMPVNGCPMTAKESSTSIIAHLIRLEYTNSRIKAFTIFRVSPFPTHWQLTTWAALVMAVQFMQSKISCSSATRLAYRCINSTIQLNSTKEYSLRPIPLLLH